MTSHAKLCLSAIIIHGALLTIGVTAARADAPDSVNYQSILKTSGGSPVPDGNYTVTLKIYDVAAGPNPALWSETKSVTTVGGLFTTLLGSVTPLPGSVFSGPNRFLGITVNPDPEMTPRTAIVSVAYAYRAVDADSADVARGTATNSVTSFSLVDGSIQFIDIAANGATAGQVIKWNGTAWVADADAVGSNVSGWTDNGTALSLQTATDSVGIGTATPAAKLDVAGNIHASGTIASGNSIIIDGINDAITASGGTLSFGDENIVTSGTGTFGEGHTNTGDGGFAAGDHNTVTGNFSTIPGGSLNVASAYATTVSGGEENQATGNFATIGGGEYNTATGAGSTTGGGIANHASGNRAVVGGGQGNTAGDYSSISGGFFNRASGTYSHIGSGDKNVVLGNYSAILVGYGDTIAVGANYSYLFGIGSKLTQDSTFMVDMPHIRFGDEATGYEIPASDGSTGQVLTTDGSGNAAWSSLPITDGHWVLSGDVLFTEDEWGIARNGNILHGEHDSTHVNLGVACTTGSSFSDNKYAVVGGGLRNAASGASSTVGGGARNKAGGSSLGLATVSGGLENVASGDLSTVGGGANNLASGIGATVAGGEINVASGGSATVGGGWGNIADMSSATVAGGAENLAHGRMATVGGGSSNRAEGDSSTVGGGTHNLAMFEQATISGGRWNYANERATTIGGGSENIANGLMSTVGGGDRNQAFGGTLGGATVAGGMSNVAYGDYSAVSGGYRNVAEGNYAVVGGGYFDSAGGAWSTVAGGFWNRAIGTHSAVGGGYSNHADGDSSTIGGGSLNEALAEKATIGGGGSNVAVDAASTISGGVANMTGISGFPGFGELSTIGGGYGNNARGQFSTIGGGASNSTQMSDGSTVGGGVMNAAWGEYATVSGGLEDTATGTGSAVGGGSGNAALADYSTVPGGWHNAAKGEGSLAAGVSAKANHSGAIVLAANSSFVDSDSVYTSSTEQMILRADGGIYLTNTSGAASIPGSDFLNTVTGAHLTIGGAWTNSSDRNKKENFQPIDRAALLRNISALDISTWNYRDEGDNVRHIGPTAQDLFALFGFGTDDKSISTIDPAGIALAAIQELHSKTQQLDERTAEIAELNRRIAALEQLIREHVDNCK